MLVVQLCALQHNDNSLASDLQDLVDLLNKGNPASDELNNSNTAISENGIEDIIDEELFSDPERAYLVGLQRKRDYMDRRYGYGIMESLRELESLARTAGLQVFHAPYLFKVITTLS